MGIIGLKSAIQIINIIHYVYCSKCELATDSFTWGLALTYSLTVTQVWASAASLPLVKLILAKRVLPDHFLQF